MEAFLLKVLGFVVATGILVTIHEFGHFWVARKMGVKVLRFSVGFGKPLYTWRSGGSQSGQGTEYVVATIPLGGYVKMLDEREAEVDPSEADQAFNRQSLAARTAIVAAGPLFNLLFAVFAFWGVLVLGETGLRPLVGTVETDSIGAQAGFAPGDEITGLNGKDTTTWGQVLYQMATSSVTGSTMNFQVTDSLGDTRVRSLAADALGDFADLEDPLGKMGIAPDVPALPPVLGKVLPGMPAEMAGLEPGDRVLSADGEMIEDWVDWVQYVRARPEKLIRLQVERAGMELSLDLVPRAIEENGKRIGQIGAANQTDPELWARYRVKYSLGLFEAIPAAFDRTWDFAVLTLKVIWRILTGEASLKNLGGPLTVADVAGQAVSAGLVHFLKLLAIISVSLGVLNLLPIPVLDGGHLLYFMFEALQGKPLSDKAMAFGQQIGLALLLALMVLVLYQDILRIFG